MFALLWGFPFLVSGEGLSEHTASLVMSLLVVGSLCAGPVFGRFVALHPLRRSWLVLTILAATVTVWTVVLLWPGPAPLGLLVVLVLVLAVGGPGSMVGFDFARSFNPPARLGTATGIVNIGGFVASLVTMLALGVVIDLVAAGRGRSAARVLAVGLPRRLVRAVRHLDARRRRHPADAAPGPAPDGRGRRGRAPDPGRPRPRVAGPATPLSAATSRHRSS